ncbi:uncharacterized protein [Ptychodera flava]|uniref:uncharacterized protein n=1 Tax=Ptychodera flava TaxID=63121 RepID=UPI003969DAF0
MDVRSLDYKLALTKLRNLGNHKHNCRVFRQGYGTLLVNYRPSRSDRPAKAEDYGPCEFCYATMVRADLYKHKCLLKPKSDGKMKRPNIAANSKLLLPPPKGASAQLNTVLCGLVEDQISRVVKSDHLILCLGEKLYNKMGHNKERHQEIRTKLREMGRLLIQLRISSGNPSAGLDVFINNVHFQLVVAAAKIVAGFNEDTHQYAIPSLALKLGHSLGKCAVILKGKALEKGDEVKTKQADRFSQLCEMNWSDEVSVHARRTLHDKKLNSVKVIPLTEDAMRLDKYLKIVEAREVARLTKDNRAVNSWVMLNEAVLAQIILFNRRRQGEASRLSTVDFDKRSNNQPDKVVLNSLSPLEQRLCRAFYRVEVIGKRGRIVPILLTEKLTQSVLLLNKTRESVGVNPQNMYVFARAYYASLGHIRGSDCIRKFANECGALCPELLTSTGLRKNMATISQIVNLKENEMDILASFLGHDIRVHREYYRLPQDTMQVAKVSKLLLAVENGLLKAGTSLDDIDLEEECCEW